jgi:hypothetical protein
LYLNKVKKLIPNIHIYNECLKNLETKEHKWKTFDYKHYLK